MLLKAYQPNNEPRLFSVGMLCPLLFFLFFHLFIGFITPVFVTGSPDSQFAILLLSPLNDCSLLPPPLSNLGGK